MKFIALADTWFDKLDPDKTGKITQEQFVAKFPEIIPAQNGPGRRRGGPAGQPDGAGGEPGDRGGPGAPPGGGPGGDPADRGGRGAPPGGGPGFNPNTFMATALFKAAVANDGDSLTRPELKAAGYDGVLPPALNFAPAFGLYLIRGANK